ncbi:MAG: diguanylate cyclase [Gammaproteobacteria bacterium]
MYDQIRVISQSGMEQIRVNFNAGVPVVVDSSRLQDKSGRYYFTEAMAVDRGQIYISPLDLNVEDGVVEQPFKPTIRCAIPLFVGENVKPVGVLVLNYMAAQMLQDFEHMMTNSWGIPMILDQGGRWLYRRDYQQKWRFLKETHASFPNDHPDAWQLFNAQDSGVFQNRDGLFIFTVLRPFSEDHDNSDRHQINGPTGWKIFSHVPNEVLRFSLTKSVVDNTSFLVILIILAGAISFLVNRLKNANLEKTNALVERESQYRNLFENMADGYALQQAIFDEAGKPYDFRYLEINSAFEKILNFKREDVIGKTVLELLPATEPYWLETFGNVAVTGKPARLEQYGGSFGRYFEIAATSPGYGLVAVIFADVTERKRTEDKLRQAAVVFNNTTEAVMVTDADAKVVSVNRAFTDITGFEPDEVINKDPKFQRSENHDEQFYQNILQSLETRGQWRGEIWNRRKDGVLYPVWENISVVKDDEGRVTHYISVFSDISSIKQTENKLSHLAHHDSLTGLANRLAFTANLEQALERAQRHLQKVALMFIDLDRFKQINDCLGHAAGDRVLQVVAQRIKKSVRGQDVVCRLGGDEFIIIVEELTHIKDIENLAEKIIKLVSQPIQIGDQKVSVSTSVGISIFPDDANTAQDLAKAGDAAMYSAKSRGRQTFAFFASQLDCVD